MFEVGLGSKGPKSYSTNVYLMGVRGSQAPMICTCLIIEDLPVYVFGPIVARVLHLLRFIARDSNVIILKIVE